MPTQNLSAVKTLNTLLAFTVESILRYGDAVQRLEPGALKAVATQIMLRREADTVRLRQEIHRLGGTPLTEVSILYNLKISPGISAPPEDGMADYVAMLGQVTSQRYARVLGQNLPLRVDLLVREIWGEVKLDLERFEGLRSSALAPDRKTSSRAGPGTEKVPPAIRCA